jgi:rubrerythrin
VIEGSSFDSLAAAGYVEFAATGEPVVGEFHCAECGYGVIVQRELPVCPMCGGTAWEAASWNRFMHTADPPLH